MYMRKRGSEGGSWLTPIEITSLHLNETQNGNTVGEESIRTLVDTFYE